ncbi:MULTISPECIES: copper chaperone CopZ [Planomicrobium]|uniref:copper chaperone CopZ n=1 Tax=Planomicrobium TaxID=162291 RepID=UPI000C7A6010|nr:MULTISPECIES: copper chaperone CopZ [Planomicrobium]PKH08767.1 hypothetical protein CXF70_15470 [Planomicrobium sp. MB-3u-38]
MKKITLEITGMSCAHCVNKIETALQDLQGVEKAKVNLKKGTAKVKYDDKVQGVDNLTAAVKEAGYEAEPVL